MRGFSLRVLPLILVLVLFFSLAGTGQVEAHVKGGESKVAGNYRIQFKTEPSIITPGREFSLLFSVQDLNGKNIEKVDATVKIVIGDSLVHEFPQRRYPSGDFALNHILQKEGDFEVVIIIAEGQKNVIVDFPLNVISESIAFLITYGTLIGFVSLLGVIGLFYVRGRRKESTTPQQISASDR